jgi:hypothetical protein
MDGREGRVLPKSLEYAAGKYTTRWCLTQSPEL